MSDPFAIVGPAVVSFSGGRTSAYMLRRILDAHGGTLPDDVVVCFANTGREMSATLDFVAECASRWGVRVRWLEYRWQPGGPWAEEVSHNSASRNGEPFEAIIKKRQYLPNPVTRFCTVELKIRAMHKHLKALGWTEWDQMVGIRADEQRRVVKIRARPSPEIVAETMVLPLADAGVTVSDVGAFWDAQPFNLELPTYKGRTLAGNCDLCFLKPAGQVLSLIAQKPERAAWWAKMEALALASKPSGAVFRSDRPSYAKMAENARSQMDAFGYDDEEGIPCYCGE